MKHFPFPDIGQYRQAIHAVTNRVRYVGKDDNGEPMYNSLATLPTIRYRGTVKLHGTNAAVVVNLKTGEHQLQSRSRIISWADDNAGFAAFMDPLVPELLTTISFDSTDDTGEDILAIYGEWCGGNIQKGVAICELPKMFVIFGAKRNDKWLTPEERRDIRLVDKRIFNNADSATYQTFEMDIDFQNPMTAQNALVDITMAVENECPVARAFGVSGIGEGVVWTPIDPEWMDSQFWFKVKGEKHSTSKVKKLASTDVEKMANIKEFVDTVVTDNRCNQALTTIMEGKVGGFTPNMIGDFLRWVFNDVVKEETDVIVASGLEKKDVGAAVSKKAKEWLFANVLK